MALIGQRLVKQPTVALSTERLNHGSHRGSKGRKRAEKAAKEDRFQKHEPGRPLFPSRQPSCEAFGRKPGQTIEDESYTREIFVHKGRNREGPTKDNIYPERRYASQ